MITTLLSVFVCMYLCVSSEVCSCFTNGIAGPSLVEHRASGHSALKRGGSDGQSEATGLDLA